ncbi:MAG: hypothetical protein M1829_002833 [Trizodia sp. TS-e1964]|nr:MAG: hypothetical protein M1829_002833 [Trizodia sp. TS-e1964]
MPALRLSDLSTTPAPHKFYVVEHLDPSISAWSLLEYLCISTECTLAGATAVLTSVSAPPAALSTSSMQLEARSIEQLCARAAPRVCLLDPAAERDLAPADAALFDVFLFGGILGDDPPRDRTAELRAKGFVGRRLGAVQMTTDTAVRVVRLVVDGQVPLEQIPFVDHPELKFNDHESAVMPFRYVKGEDGKPVMPEGMMELIEKDSDQSFDDFL